jgi:hypothetical protein
MTPEQNLSVRPKRRLITLIVPLLPMAIGIFILVGPEMSGAFRHLLYAAFFAALSGPAITLALERRVPRWEWLFVTLCAVLAAWSIYNAVQEWGVPAS